MDLYLVLGVAPDATPGQIRRAFRELALVLHPDRAGPASAARFRELVEAYRALSDPEQRADHDAARHRPAVRRPVPPREPAEPLRPRLPGRLLLPAGLRDGAMYEAAIEAPGHGPVTLWVRVHVLG